MPEGPEVETVRRSLEPLLVGRQIISASSSNKALRVRQDPRALKGLIGACIAALDRHGKLLWIALQDGRGLAVRLGMSGQLVVVDAQAPRRPHTHIALGISDGHELRYVDPRRFGTFVVSPAGDELVRERARLGPDGLVGLDEPVVVDRVVEALRGTARAVKQALLDQLVVAGVGNIYAAEILYLARVHPLRAGRSLSQEEARRIVTSIPVVLREAADRRGTSFSDYVDARGERGDNAAHLAVFQRAGEPCPRCGTRVVRVVSGQRSTFFCPRCQPAARKRPRPKKASR